MSASEHLNPRLFELPDRPEKVDVSKWADEQPVWHASYSRLKLPGM